MSLALASAIIGLLGATGTAQAAGDVPQAEAHELMVRVEGGLVSAEIVNVPLGEAVTELARQAGFKLVLEGDFDRRVSLARSGIKVADLLGELMQNCSWFSVFGAAGAETEARLSQVWILQSPECQDPRVLGSDSGSQPPARVQRVVFPSSVMGNRELKERQQHLGQVIKGQTRVSMDEVLDAARDSREVSIRILALMALGRGGGPEAKAMLVEALSDENQAVRKAAVRSLARGWKDEAVVPINALLSSESNIAVVQVALQQLRQIGTDAAWEGLHRAADSNNPKVTSIALKSIAQLEDERQRLMQGQ